MSEAMSEETLAMLEERGKTTRSPSVRLLTAEVRALRAKGARDQEWIDRLQGDLAGATVEVMRLRAALVRTLNLADAYRLGYAETSPTTAQCFDDIHADLEAALERPQ